MILFLPSAPNAFKGESEATAKSGARAFALAARVTFVAAKITKTASAGHSPPLRGGPLRSSEKTGRRSTRFA
ncbi:hypothetical protein, partial [Pseudoxanthomonas composti]|uniref:hypothetical protein n=1 Tax=Pseudoxanthomonas composti TaxID=2137479 RepID=UPI0019D6BF8B